MATFLGASVGEAGASGVTVLPNAVSYEYFGLNFAINIATSSSVGTLNYTGDPGCGGTCTATTSLGSDPSVSLNVNEVTFQNTSGGFAEAELGYYVEYVNTPGTYTVVLHSGDTLSVPFSPAFPSAGQAYLGFGPAGSDTTSRASASWGIARQRARFFRPPDKSPVSSAFGETASRRSLFLGG
jgi:hypothetical protein